MPLVVFGETGTSEKLRRLRRAENAPRDLQISHGPRLIKRRTARAIGVWVRSIAVRQLPLPKGRIAGSGLEIQAGARLNSSEGPAVARALMLQVPLLVLQIALIHALEDGIK